MRNLRKLSILVASSLTLASTLFSLPSAVAASGSSIFTIAWSPGVYKRAIDGSGSATTVGSVNSAVAIAATDTYIYYGFGSIRRMNLDGTGTTLLRTVSDAYNFIVTDNYIYYGYEFSRKIGRMNLDGTGANDAWLDYSANSSAPFSAVLMINGSDIYFGGGNNGGMSGYAGNIWRTTTSGTTPTSFTSDTNVNAGIQDMVTDGTYLYWTNYRSGNIGRVLLDGTSNSSNWVTGLSTPWGMDISGNTIYFNHTSYIGKVNTDGTGLDKTWRSNSNSAQGLSIGGPSNSATISLQLVNSANNLIYRQTTNSLLRAVVSNGGKVTFYQNGKVIPGCRSVLTSSGTVDCTWKPSVHGLVSVYAVIASTTSAFPTAKSESISLKVIKRTSLR